MTAAVDEIFAEAFSPQALPLPIPQSIQNGWRTRAHRRLTEVYQTAKRVPFDDSSRIAFFSDCHRGDNSLADIFARNKELFLHALDHYYREGFTYIEVGDGDELLKNRRFSDIRRAHGQIFDLLHRFDGQNRLHLILGNHEIRNGRRDRVEKDGLVATEGLVLCHSNTGQQIFVVHGHQADFKCDRFHLASRFLTRYIVKQLQLARLGNRPSRADDTRNRRNIRQRIVEWQQVHQPIVICGHTHSPTFPTNGGPPYFNAGSCLYADYITGLEIRDGEIMPVKWHVRSRGPGKAPRIERELAAQPRRLRLLT